MNRRDFIKQSAIAVASAAVVPVTPPTFKYGGGTVIGYLNFPNRVTQPEPTFLVNLITTFADGTVASCKISTNVPPDEYKHFTFWFDDLGHFVMKQEKQYEGFEHTPDAFTWENCILPSVSFPKRLIEAKLFEV